LNPRPSGYEPDGSPRKQVEGETLENLIKRSGRLRAATQVPEITVAIHSFLNAGFLSAVQVELLFMIEEPSSRYKGNPVSEFQEFCS
jgi:hypothetical protein